MKAIGVWALVFLSGLTLCRSQTKTDVCPEKFWQEPTKQCLQIIDSVLDELVTGEWQMADVRINKTCKAYDKMKTCMDELLEKCSQDETRVNDLRKVIDRYTPYSLPCHDEALRHRQRVIDCFHEHISGTRKCVNSFDRSYKSHIVDKDYPAACRDIEDVMHCFHTTKTTIHGQCGDEGAAVYEMNYILPIVEPTSGLVVDHCQSLSSPYRQYYGMSNNGGQSCHDIALATYGFVILAIKLLP